MTVTALDPQYLAPGHTITRLANHPQIWHCSCTATGRGEPMSGTPEIVNVLHDEARWKRWE